MRTGETYSRKGQRRAENAAGRMRITGVLMSSMLLIGMLPGCGKEEGLPEGAITSLSRTIYTETITADGTVECADPHFIYSTLTLPVEEIFVKEGDMVSEGDLLCILDTDTIEEQIELMQATMDLTQRNAYTNIVSAQHRYTINEEGLVNGTNTELVSAMSKLELAREAYETAQKQYEDYKESLHLGMDPTLVSADQAVALAAEAIRQANSMQTELDEEDGISDIEMEKAEDAIDSANLQYAQAIQTRENLLRQSDILLADYAKNAEDQLINYVNAQSVYDSVVHALENARVTGTDAINQAMLSGDVSVETIQLAQLEQKLLDAQIISGFSGTVTAVNIEVGENSTGVLFVIEDTKDLVLSARVPEKDINRIFPGMETAVTPKADGSDPYSGIVRRIADSSAKNASGETDTSGEDAEFKVTVLIGSPDEKLRIGMNAEAEFVIYRQEDCFAVANEAIGTDAEGNTFVLTVKESGEELQIDKAFVTITYAGKNMSVIEGEAVTDGARILNDANEYAALVGTTVQGESR